MAEPPESGPEPQPQQLKPEPEPARVRAGRYARHARLYTWLAILVVLIVFLVILVAENTREVKVGWIFGYSHFSLIYLVLISTLLGWLLGIATSVLVLRRTRRPPRA